MLDTHLSDYYKNPTAKIDVSLSDSEEVRMSPSKSCCSKFGYARSVSQARWPTLVSAMELKTELSSVAAYKTVVGQVRFGFLSFPDEPDAFPDHQD